MKSVIALLAVVAIAGCGPISYENDIVPVHGRKIFVEPAKITNCHESLDRANTEKDIVFQAKSFLSSHGYSVVDSAGEADLVLRAEVLEFNLGSTTARVITGHGQSWHDTNIVIQPNGPPPNVGHRRAEVSAGAYSNWKGPEQHRRALVDEIARMHLWVAQKYCK